MKGGFIITSPRRIFREASLKLTLEREGMMCLVSLRPPIMLSFKGNSHEQKRDCRWTTNDYYM